MLYTVAANLKFVVEAENPLSAIEFVRGIEGVCEHDPELSVSRIVKSVMDLPRGWDEKDVISNNPSLNSGSQY